MSVPELAHAGKKERNIALGIGLGLLAVAVALQGDPRAVTSTIADEALIDKGFEQIDTNKDGLIGRQEFGTYMMDILAMQRTALNEGLKELDTNQEDRSGRGESQCRTRRHRFRR